MPPRPATPADAPAVAALVRAAYAPHAARIGRPPGPMLDDYAALIAAGRVEVLDGAEGLDAALVLIPQPDALLLGNVAVAPARQGRGLGRALIAHAEARARAGGYPRLRLYTHESMVENRALYARCGFVETARRVENGLARVYMEKPS